MEQDIVGSRLTAMLEQRKPSPNQQQHRNLQNHLSQLLSHLPSLKSDKISPLAHLQVLSEYFKNNQFRPTAPLSEQQLSQFVQKAVEYPPWLWAQQNLEGHRVKESQGLVVSDFEGQSDRLLNKVGLGFGVSQSHRIQLTLKRLADKHKVQGQIRFWGKIYTEAGDYWVVEARSRKQQSADIEASSEQLGEGVNYNTYWVAHSTAQQDWYELPPITPEHLVTSRLIKYVFKGDLNHPVKSSPPFPGQEKHLLKAQIVRITHNCEIIPRGLMAPLEDNPDEVELAEEFKMPEFAELTNLENWSHLNPYLLKLGRANYYVDPSLSEEQKEELQAKWAENDPKIERLKAINEDKGLGEWGLEGCWTTRVYGNSQVFNSPKEDGTSCYAVTTLRNPHWPGWTTVASGKQFASIYLGFGDKSSQPPFHPLGPEDIAIEADEVDEVYEPNPRDPPDELEPDSDDENKKPEDQ